MSDLVKHIRCTAGDIAPYVLIPGDPARAGRIAERLTDARLVAQNREYTVYTGTYEGVPVSVCSTGIGGPSTAIAMEELSRCGAETFIRVGSAGARRDGIDIGEPVIVSGAIRAGGTAQAYLPLSFPAVADIGVLNALTEAAKQLGIKAQVGLSLSRDAFYRQDAALNETLRPVHAVAVSEMECDTVFVVAAALNKRAGAVVGTDSNLYLPVQPSREEKERLYLESEKRTISIALKACALLANV
ncbi:MAG: nucleoside phosphorylase [Clostridia bacterium]|nr:nucleoside phosphorylase [Clostridia bacterium]